MAAMLTIKLLGNLNFNYRERKDTSIHGSHATDSQSTLVTKNSVTESEKMHLFGASWQPCYR
jgi:hypothetical protein